MRDIKSVPMAPMLIESIRAIGYTFEAAIADLIDNSITAGAKNIDIMCLPSDEPVMYIYDDGIGMDDSELEEAMRLGSQNPNEVRNENDLGRFGLGLKTASLSQCKNLTVASKKDGIISAYRWDLEHVKETNDWSLLKLDDIEIEKSDFYDRLKNVQTGTCLILKDFDRVKNTTDNLKDTMTTKLSDLETHLSLVFHRFIDDGLVITINNRPVDSIDPFLLSNSHTQRMKEKAFYVGESKITVRPIVLPHMNQISDEELVKVGGKEDLRKNQGFYIYRNKRLIIWGTWFRLYRQEELGKNARVIVEIPNSLDNIWEIDVKKSNANIPDSIRKQLYSSVEESIGGSKKIYTHRGRVVNDSSKTYIWEKRENRGSYEYHINREMPIINALLENLDDKKINLFERILKDIEENFPIESAYADCAVGKAKTRNEYDEDEDNIKDKIKHIGNLVEGCDDTEKKKWLERLLLVEGYGDNERIRNYINEEIEKCMN